MRILIIDTETTSAVDAVACEIAALQLNDDLSGARAAEGRCNPGKPISAAASGVHGITDEDVQHCPSPAEWMLEHEPLFTAEEILLIGHNIQFDYDVLKDELVKYTDKPIRLLCTLRLARHLWPDAENHKLQTLMYWLKLPRAGSHNAMDDVMTCYHMLHKIKRDFGLDLAGMIALAASPINVTHYTFGKHRGELVAGSPADYRAWLLKQDWLDADLRHTLEELRKPKPKALAPVADTPPWEDVPC